MRRLRAVLGALALALACLVWAPAASWAAGTSWVPCSSGDGLVGQWGSYADLGPASAGTLPPMPGSLGVFDGSYVLVPSGGVCGFAWTGTMPAGTVIAGQTGTGWSDYNSGLAVTTAGAGEWYVVGYGPTYTQADAPAGAYSGATWSGTGFVLAASSASLLGQIAAALVDPAGAVVTMVLAGAVAAFVIFGYVPFWRTARHLLTRVGWR